MFIGYRSKIFLNIFKNIRFLSSNSPKFAPAAYEGSGKTTVTILNTDADLGLMINGVSQVGFRLNNDITVLGPMVIFPRSVLAWNVRYIEDITEESLSLFTVLEPKLDIVILGVGDKLKDHAFYMTILPLMRKYRLNIEVLPTEQACATFNYLNSEGRYVGAALIPPTTMHITDDDLIKTKLRYQNLYESEG